MEDDHTVEEKENEENILKCCLCFAESKLKILADGLKGLIETLLSVELQTPASGNEPQLICSPCHEVITNVGKFRKRIRKIQRQSHSGKIQKNVQRKTNDESFRKEPLDAYQTKKKVLERDTGKPSHKEKYDASQAKKSAQVNKSSSKEPHETSQAKKNSQDGRKQLKGTHSRAQMSSDDHTDLVDTEELQYISEETARSLLMSKSSELPVTLKEGVREMNTSSVEEKNENASEEPSSSVFICDLCSYHSCRPKDFSRHVRSHGHLTFQHRICSLCSHICNGVSDLLAHRKEVHADIPISYKCSICDDSFATKHEVHTHKLSVHNIVTKRGFRCKACKRIFSDKIVREKHQCRSKSFECPWKCGKKFETLLEVKQHHRNCRPGSTIYKCSRCKKRLSCLATLKAHDKLCAAQYKKARADENVARLEKTYLNENGAQPGNSGSEGVTQNHTSAEKNTTGQQQKSGSVGSENVNRRTVGTFMCKKCCNKFSTVSALEIHFASCQGDYSSAKKCFCGVIFLTDKSLELHKLSVHRISVSATPKNPLPKIADSSDSSSSSDSDSSDSDECNESKPVLKSVQIENTRNEDIKPTCGAVIGSTSENNDHISPVNIKTEHLSDDFNFEQTARRDLRNISDTQTIQSRAIQEVKEADSSGHFEVDPHYENPASIKWKSRKFISNAHPRSPFRPRGGGRGSHYVRPYNKRQWSRSNRGYYARQSENMRPYHESPYVRSRNKFGWYNN